MSCSCIVQCSLQSTLSAELVLHSVAPKSLHCCSVVCCNSSRTMLKGSRTCHSACIAAPDCDSYLFGRADGRAVADAARSSTEPGIGALSQLRDQVSPLSLASLMMTLMASCTYQDAPHQSNHLLATYARQAQKAQLGTYSFNQLSSLEKSPKKKG